MKKKTIFLFAAMIGTIACSLSIAKTKDLLTTFATEVSSKDVTFSIRPIDGSPYYEEDGDCLGHWSYSSSFYIELDSSNSDDMFTMNELIGISRLMIVDKCILTINCLSSISSILLNVQDTFINQYFDEVTYSDNVISKTKVDGKGVLITRNDSNPITISTSDTFFGYIEAFTYTVGTLKTYSPIGGYVKSGGKKAIAAFGYQYTGLAIEDGGFGVAISEDNENFTEYNNGTYTALTSNNGNFYMYKLDSVAKKYYSKGFIKFGNSDDPTVTFTDIVDSIGDLLGQQYSI